jgi:hypothetical protein
MADLILIAAGQDTADNLTCLGKLPQDFSLETPKPMRPAHVS